MTTQRVATTPEVGDKIRNQHGTWTLVSRSGSRIRYGRQAERGWYEETGFTTKFPAYTWDTCPSCGGPATRYVSKAGPQFDCCDPERQQ